MNDALFEAAGERVRLSAAGEARRGMIGDLLTREAGRRRARRHAARGLFAAAPVLIIAVAWSLSAGGRAVAPAPTAHRTASAEGAAPPEPAVSSDSPIPPTVEPPPRRSFRIATVRTDPGIVGRYATTASPGNVRIITDSELSRWLAAAGHNPGIIRTGEEVVILAAADLRRSEHGR